ncbi:M16 family metallopeptidase [Pararoseomonas indoligenes]|uniref:Insulinase family protein n=1 Tax=Roseomonas indoligenes TaxID=2820811 RepID=A0A940MVQ0_9PROT|nr:pitrilysin family protein [Pararoseomonas indoligenes]MBP0491371.1 insulinase family protein [Pararoseomonas indoligenes]
MSDTIPSGFTLPVQVVEAAGVSAWLAEDHSVPVISIAFSIPGGAALDPAGQEGAVALASALLTEGAGGMDANAFQEAMRDNAISFNFSADRDEFSGSFRCIGDALPEATRLARLALTAPRMEAPDIERVRARAIAGARQALENPRGQAGRAFWSAALPGAYGHPPGGTAESIATLTADTLRGVPARQLRKGGLLVAASGAITADQLKDVMAALFGDWPSEEPAGLPRLPPFSATGVTVLPMESPQSAAVFGHQGLAVDDQDWEAAGVVLRILSGGGFSSRLMLAVRVERGLAYGIGAGPEPVAGRSLIIGSVATENARMAETLSVLRGEWARMAASGPTAAEREEAIAYLTGSQPLSFTSTRQVANILLALRRNNRPLDWLSNRPARLAALTRERLTAVAARVLLPDSLAVVVAGKPVGL